VSTAFRRILLAVLIRAGRPMTVAELAAAAPPEYAVMADAKRISDVLRFQASRGRVRRVRRGTYAYVPGSMSRSTVWRHTTFVPTPDHLPMADDDRSVSSISETAAARDGPAPRHAQFGDR